MQCLSTSLRVKTAKFADADYMNWGPACEAWTTELYKVEYLESGKPQFTCLRNYLLIARICNRYTKVCAFPPEWRNLEILKAALTVFDLKCDPIISSFYTACS